MFEPIEEKLNSGAHILLDGGTGTEMQRKGAPMDGEVWCALATRSHPDILRNVHADYIKAGADIITANTFATSPVILRAHGLLDQMEELDRLAVAVARQACEDTEDRPVAIAGSMSAMRPMVPGTDKVDTGFSLPEHEARPLYRRKAETLANAGVDLIIMEMMRDLDYSLWASEAAAETGLPVWMGISVQQRDDGVLCGYNRPDSPFEDLIGPLMATGASALMIMHSSVPDTDAALATVRRHWNGPLGAYPESGYFTIPDWVFGELSVEAFAAKACEWRRQGVQIIGGCCGISPEHIAAAHDALGTLKLG